MQLLLMSLTAMLAATDGTRADTLPHLFLSSSHRPSFSHLSSSRRASFTHPSHKQPYTHRSSTHKYAHRSSLHKTSYAHMSSSSLPQPVPLVMKTARFVVVSEGRYDHAHHTHGWEDHESREPHFAGGNTSTEVYLGNTVTLDCTVHDMLNESVSWMRRVDDMLELITWDSHTYAKDDRYSLVRESGDRWHRWQLVIRRTRVEDRGQYRCQVATQPPLVLVVTLNVTEPVTRVVDERGTKVLEKHYNSGSMIELKCIIEKVPFPHGPVTWRRDATTLTYNTSRGGISVKGDAAAGYIRSRLYVADASPSDSGLYSCWYGNYTSDTVTVHVIAGENSAAMQHDALPGSSITSGAGAHLPSIQLLPLLSGVYLAYWFFVGRNPPLELSNTKSDSLVRNVGLVAVMSESLLGFRASESGSKEACLMGTRPGHNS